MLTLTGQRLPAPEEVAAALLAFMERPPPHRTADLGSFDAYSARASTRALAEALDRAVARGTPR